jgi:hypothetical protein
MLMYETAANFIRARQIDSFQKLRVLLFIYQHPTLTGTIQDFSSQLYLGDIPMLENIVTDLCRTGLLDCVGKRFKLGHDADAHSCLECLRQVFDDPLARQRVLDQVRNIKSSYLSPG